MKTLHLNCLLFIYKMMQASKAHESVPECSKTWLYITVKFYGCYHEPLKCDRDPHFQVAYLNRNLTQFRLSEIHFRPSPTARNGSLDMRQPEMSRTYHKFVLIV